MPRCWNGPPATPEQAHACDGGRVDAHMQYYTYVLLSQSDNLHYIGWTSDIKARLKKHFEGKVIATKDRRPLKLVYCEICLHKQKRLKEKNILGLVLVEDF